VFDQAWRGKIQAGPEEEVGALGATAGRGGITGAAGDGMFETRERGADWAAREE